MPKTKQNKKSFEYLTCKCCHCLLLSDVTHAYKVLLAEKQALEITLKSFKTKVQPAPPQQQQQTSDAASSAGKSSASDSLESAAQSTSQQHSASESSPSATADNGDSEKIAALTSNIQLLLENKSKMEMGYQAEKKKLKVSASHISQPPCLF